MGLTPLESVHITGTHIHSPCVPTISNKSSRSPTITVNEILGIADSMLRFSVVSQ